MYLTLVGLSFSFGFFHGGETSGLEYIWFVLITLPWSDFLMQWEPSSPVVAFAALWVCGLLNAAVIYALGHAVSQR